jgi:hypothetical protein
LLFALTRRFSPAKTNGKSSSGIQPGKKGRDSVGIMVKAITQTTDPPIANPVSKPPTYNRHIVGPPIEWPICEKPKLTFADIMLDCVRLSVGFCQK